MKNDDVTFFSGPLVSEEPEDVHPAAATPASTMSHRASRFQTISFPCARVPRRTSEFIARAPVVMTSAPRAGVIRVEASLRQIVQVAADTPARIAKRTAWLNAARRGPARS